MISRSRKKRRRVARTLAIAGAALVLLGLLGAVGYHLFTGWRARDLAAKARENFQKSHYRMAWLQIGSARQLRPEEPEVLRVLGLIEGAMGRREALGHYEKLAGRTDLTPEDLKTRAALAVRFGSDAQFAEAVDALEAAGQSADAGRLRTARNLRSGDLDRAITEARTAAGASGDPALRLGLARLLVERHGLELRTSRTPSAAALAGSAEMMEIIDGLIGTPQGNEGLAFALQEVPAIPAARRRWADAALGQVTADNPALLPAAVVLVRSGQKTPRQIHEQFRPVFDSAPLERRAAYALWLNAAGLAKEAVTLVTAQEAGESTAAFVARTEALLAMDNADAVLAAVGAGGNIDADVRLAAKARAEYARGRGAQGGAVALGEALDAAAQAGRLEEALPTGDALGASGVVDDKLVDLSGNPAVAEQAFRAARDRFSRNGRPSLLASAYERALSAAPQAASVRDHTRYLALCGAGSVEVEETAAAVAAQPADVSARITHALNLLQRQRPAEALSVFDEITVFADRLAPGQQAVLAAILAANGQTDRARALAATIDPGLLSTEEYALVAPLRLPAAVP